MSESRLNRCIVAGSRTLHDYEYLPLLMDRLVAHFGMPTEVISGHAKGIDRMGEAWAREHDVALHIMPADWDKYGKSAGYRRNTEMAARAHSLFAVIEGDSRGTTHMIDIAKERGLLVVVYNVDTDKWDITPADVTHDPDDDPDKPRHGRDCHCRKCDVSRFDLLNPGFRDGEAPRAWQPASDTVHARAAVIEQQQRRFHERCVRWQKKAAARAAHTPLDGTREYRAALVHEILEHHTPLDTDWESLTKRNFLTTVTIDDLTDPRTLAGQLIPLRVSDAFGSYEALVPFDARANTSNWEFTSSRDDASGRTDEWAHKVTIERAWDKKDDEGNFLHRLSSDVPEDDVADDDDLPAEEWERHWGRANAFELDRHDALEDLDDFDPSDYELFSDDYCECEEVA